MLPKSPPHHSMQRRSRNHDYSRPSLYMVTLVTAHRSPLFGRLVCDPVPDIEFSPLGFAIARDEIDRISQAYPNLKVRRYCIMPDHIHMIIHVMEDFPIRKDGKRGHLGHAVASFKAGCLKAYKNICDNPQIPLFEGKYNDRIILGDRHYHRWKRYLDDNPRRLAIKRSHPDYFTVLHNIDICGRECQIVGNRFLLEMPDKMAVIVHRADSEEAYREKFRQWMECGQRGGILVSASIADREKSVMREAINRGYRIILLRENGFPPLYKPAGEAFDACSSGQLLQISPWEHHVERRIISRQQCLELNSLAETIANSLD